MIICEVNKNHLNVRTRELLTAGSQNVNTVEFRFNAAWDGLAKTATFKTSKKTISVLLNTNTTAIPWEALADAGEILAVGVFGVSGETIVLPTVWGILGKVMDAAHLGDEEKEPTPDVYQKILDELNALERPTWDALQNKPFSTLGSGLEVDKNGVLSAQGGESGSGELWYPTVTDGVISWTKSAAETAPEPADIRGPQGKQGEQGIQGEQGPKGDTGEQGIQGEQGLPGTDGQNGVTPTIGDNGNWYLGDTDTGKPSRGEAGPAGANGADGHTPVRGMDYWTEEDQQAIVDDVLATLPTWEGGGY